MKLAGGLAVAGGLLTVDAFRGPLFASLPKNDDDDNRNYPLSDINDKYDEWCSGYDKAGTPFWLCTKKDANYCMDRAVEGVRVKRGNKLNPTRDLLTPKFVCRDANDRLTVGNQKIAGQTCSIKQWSCPELVAANPTRCAVNGGDNLFATIYCEESCGTCIKADEPDVNSDESPAPPAAPPRCSPPPPSPSPPPPGDTTAPGTDVPVNPAEGMTDDGSPCFA